MVLKCTSFPSSSNTSLLSETRDQLRSTSHRRRLEINFIKRMVEIRIFCQILQLCTNNLYREYPSCFPYRLKWSHRYCLLMVRHYRTLLCTLFPFFIVIFFTNHPYWYQIFTEVILSRLAVFMIRYESEHKEVCKRWFYSWLTSFILPSRANNYPLS